MKRHTLSLLALATTQLAALPPNEVSITIVGDKRVITSNGIPDHPTGQFPGPRNPNTISEQNQSFQVPAAPEIAPQTTPLGMHPFGVAVNGVVLDPGAAEWWNRDRFSGWQYEPLSGVIDLGTDQSNAHVQPTGAYHYHGIPNELIQNLTGGRPQMVLIGWAADGFPIYGEWGYSDPTDPESGLTLLASSYAVKQGTRPSGPGGTYDGSFVEDYEYVAGLGNLDEANGTFGPTPEFPEGIYHYHVTDSFPFIPRMFKGTPDSSFFRGGPGGPGGARRFAGPSGGGRQGGPGTSGGPPPFGGGPPGFSGGDFPPPPSRDGRRGPPPGFPPPGMNGGRPPRR